MMISYYKPKKISELNEKTDRQVVLVGKLIEAGEARIVIDDDSSKIELAIDNTADKNLTDKNLKIGQMVRVFCTMGEGRVKADIIQDLSNMDMELFYKVKELYSKAGV